jgi:hypothetical protein
MNVIEVKKFQFDEEYPGLEKISDELDRSAVKNRIGIVNWKQFGYKPDISFSMGYTDREILIKYYVTEDYFKAEMTETNQPVCQDSCVEFFVSPANDGIYYNLEFNGIGTVLMGTGKSRETSVKADKNIISGIRRISSAGNRPVAEKKGPFSWTMTAAIPLPTFFHHNVTDLKGRTFRANFYKCGDNLTVPHYVTWNPVGTENPDYHQPKYFGLVKFV